MNMPTIERVAFVPQPKSNEFTAIVEQVAGFPADEMAQVTFTTEKEAHTFLANLQRAAKDGFENVTVKKSLVAVADKSGKFQQLSDGSLVNTGWTRGTVQQKSRETGETVEREGYAYGDHATVLGFRVVQKEAK